MNEVLANVLWSIIRVLESLFSAYSICIPILNVIKKW